MPALILKGIAHEKATTHHLQSLAGNRAYNDRTGHGQDMDAPGSSLATFDTYEEARDYAERVTGLAEGINL